MTYADSVWTFVVPCDWKISNAQSMTEPSDSSTCYCNAKTWIYLHKGPHFHPRTNGKLFYRTRFFNEPGLLCKHIELKPDNYSAGRSSLAGLVRCPVRLSLFKSTWARKRLLLFLSDEWRLQFLLVWNCLPCGKFENWIRWIFRN